MAAIKGPRLYKKQIGTHREKKHVLTLTLMLVRRKSACETSAGSSKIFRWLAPLLGPNLDPKTGPKQRPKRRNENVTQFWTPFWGPYLDPKMGPAIGEFRCCPQMFCKQICDPAAWTWMSTHTFSLCASQGRFVQETNWDAQREKACVNTYAHASASQICLRNIPSSKIFRWLAPLLGPNLDPKTGPKQRPKTISENVTQWPHFGVHIWTQKWGQPSENFVAARKCFASRFATRQLEHECQHIPFLFVRPKAACYCTRNKLGRTERKSMC